MARPAYALYGVPKRAGSLRETGERPTTSAKKQEETDASHQVQENIYQSMQFSNGSISLDLSDMREGCNVFDHGRINGKLVRDCTFAEIEAATKLLEEEQQRLRERIRSLRHQSRIT